MWIGFKILYLCDLKQFQDRPQIKHFCCELVSKFCIFVIWNSGSQIKFINIPLWIGFKILYLCDLKQYELRRKKQQLSCELVSKFCIFVIWNSDYPKFSPCLLVVNWFQNFVSLWSETVSTCSRIVDTSCELVSKFCIFLKSATNYLELKTKPCK